MSSKKDYSKKIIRILGEKTAVSVPNLTQTVISEDGSKKESYALTRAVKNLTEGGFVETLQSDNQDYLRLTKEGRQKVLSLKLEQESVLVPTTWDGYWRIIILDLPESRKNERESLRYLLKKAGFICVKNAVWISMYPFEHLFINIKQDLGFTTEMMVIVTDKIDKSTEEAFWEIIKK